MGRPANNIAGQRVGYMTAIQRVGSTEGNKPLWELRCDCGEVRYSTSSRFIAGQLQSCGCKKKQIISERNTRHGLSRHPIYAVWDTMIARCHRPTHKSYIHYSQRGITVCEGWRNSFQAFADDMFPTYKSGLQLDRIDNDGGYNKDNCRWASATTQANNTSSNRMITTPKGSLTVAQAAREFGIGVTTLLNRIETGWPQEQWFIPASYKNKVMK